MINVLSTFNIEKGESKAVSLLLIYSFFMGVGIAFFYTASTSLFLVNFERVMLPYAYIIGGLSIFFFGRLFSQIQKKVHFSKLISGSAIFLLITVGLLLTIYEATGNKWVAFVMFIWIRILLFIQGVSFWGIANKVFDLRQGKRLYGLIGSGEVISHIISFFSIPFILKLVNTEDLLFLSIAGFIISILFLYAMLKSFKQKLKSSSDKKTNKKIVKKANKKATKNKYYKYFFYMAIFPMFAIFFVDFIFFAQTQVEFPVKDVLSSFLGIFFGVGAIIEFLLKTFVSGRMLSKYGLKLGLISLPFVLGLSVLLASVAGMIYGMAGLFFSFVAFSKISLRSVRTSFYDPSFQILYQPLPTNKRFAFQSKIEGGPKAFGNIIAGGVLLLMSSISAVTLVHFNIVFFVILLIWLGISLQMFKEYRNILKKVIFHTKSKLHEVDIEEESTINILNAHLIHNESQNVYKVFRIFEKLEPYQFIHSMEYLLSHSSNKLKQQVIEQIGDYRLVKLLKPLELNTDIEGGENLKKTILESSIKLKETENTSFEKIKELCNSNSAKDRKLAAILLGDSGRYNAFKLIINLLKDEDQNVKETALISAGRLKRFELWKYLIENLSNPLYSNAAASAIKIIGPGILEYLDLEFRKKGENRDLQVKIVKLIEDIDDAKAVAILRKMINHPDRKVRFEVFRALSKKKYTVKISEASIIKQELETEVELAVTVLAAISDIESYESAENVLQALYEEFKEKKESVFLLLSLLYDSKVIHRVKSNFEKEGENERVFAIEILDMTVAHELKDLILPLLDGNNNKDTLNNYKLRFPQPSLNIIDRLIDIINMDYAMINNWTKACAIEMLIHYSSGKSLQVLAANIVHPDTLIMDTAATVLNNIDKNRYMDTIARLNKTIRNRLKDTTDSLKQNEEGRMLLQKTRMLKKAPLFKDTPEVHLTKLLYSAKEIIIKKDEHLNTEASEYFYMVFKGKIERKHPNYTNQIYTPSDTFGEYISNDIIGNGYVYIARETSVLLKFELEELFYLMGERLEVLENTISMFDYDMSERNLNQIKVK